MAKRYLYRIAAGAFVVSAMAMAAGMAQADQVIADDVIINGGSLCIGVDCVNGESFGLQLLRFKNDVIQIDFEDTSNTAGFPSNDWRILVNNTSEGGQNFFALQDVTGGTVPFKVAAGASANAFFVGSGSNVGLGTTAPSANLHITGLPESKIRFSDAALSWYTWDVVGALTGFKISNASGPKTPMTISSAAPDNALYVGNTGIGLGTFIPDGPLHVHRDSAFITLDDANDNDKWWISHGATNSGNLEFTSMLDYNTLSPKANVAMVIEPDGDMGLGTLVPDGPLHIADNSAFITLEDKNDNDKWYITHQAGDNGNFEFTSVLNGALVNLAFSVEPDGDMIIDGTLTENSDKNAKMAIEPVDGAEVLQKLAALDVAEWSYIDDTSGARHIGPMAQDFRALFGLGATETGISTLDTSGVALAAIQALAARDAEMSGRIDALLAEVHTLSQENTALRARLEAR